MDGTLNSKFKYAFLFAMCFTIALVFSGVGVPVCAEPPGLKINVSKLRDKDVSERRKAARLLYCRTDKVAVSALIEALENDEDDNVRALAANSLGKIRNRWATDSLVKALRDEKPVVRIEAIRALGDLGDEKAIEPLKGMLDSKDARERCLSAQALGNLGDKSGLKAALKEMENENPRTRVKAVLALKAIVHQEEKAKFPEVMQSLKSATDDEDESVRSAADFTLKYFGEKLKE